MTLTGIVELRVAAAAAKTGVAASESGAQCTQGSPGESSNGEVVIPADPRVAAEAKVFVLDLPAPPDLQTLAKCPVLPHLRQATARAGQRNRG